MSPVYSGAYYNNGNNDNNGPFYFNMNNQSSNVNSNYGARLFIAQGKRGTKAALAAPPFLNGKIAQRAAG